MIFYLPFLNNRSTLLYLDHKTPLKDATAPVLNEKANVVPHDNNDILTKLLADSELDQVHIYTLFLLFTILIIIY